MPPNKDSPQSSWPVEIASSLGPPPGADIPDLTELSDVSLFLFGVPCSTKPYGRGCFNQLHRLTLQDPPNGVPSNLLARIAGHWKTHSDISIESEVATMMYVKQHTTIPIPTVYGYCKDEHNPVGCPFMIMEHMEGERMVDSDWEQQSPEFKLIALRDYARIIFELSRLRFDTIGSLYFKGNDRTKFEVGPICWPRFHTAYRKTLPIYDRGPFKSVTQLLEASIKDSLQFIEANPSLARKVPFPRLDDTELWNSAPGNLRRGLQLIPKVINEASASGPFVLSHPDLTLWNMLCATSGPNAGKIVGVVDWEMAATIPLWWLLCPPNWLTQSLFDPRNHVESQLFESTYFKELERLTGDARMALIAQNAQPRRAFGDSAVLPWSEGSSVMGMWEEKYGEKHAMVQQFY